MFFSTFMFVAEANANGYLAEVRKIIWRVWGIVKACHVRCTDWYQQQIGPREYACSNVRKGNDDLWVHNMPADDPQ